MTRRLLFALAALSLVLVACGGGIEERQSAVTVDTKPDNGGTAPPTTAGDDDGLPPGQDPRNILGGEGQEEDDAAVACFEGDMAACDELFRITDLGSALESYAQTCGGRIDEQEGAPGCAARFGEIGDAQPPGNLSDDPELSSSSRADIARFEDLADECFEGDLGACDDLFFGTPVGSGFEEYGSTCGGRLEGGVRGLCESQLGSGSDSDSSVN